MEIEVSVPRHLGFGVYPPGATFGPRVGKDWAFIWVIRGECEYRWGERCVPVAPGDMVLSRPGAIDAWQWDRAIRTEHAYVHFDVLSRPAEWPDGTAWPFVRSASESEVCRFLFQHLLAEQGRMSPMQSRLTLATMLSAFVTGAASCGTEPHEQEPDPVRRAREFIVRRLEEDPAAAITLSDLAGAACVAREHLCRAFRASTGHSPLEAVRLARLDRAKMLLLRSDFSIGEIADLCGFSSASHFSQAFKGAYAVSPSAIRRAVAGGMTPPQSRSYRDRRALSFPRENASPEHQSDESFG